MNNLITRLVACPTCLAEPGFPCTNASAFGRVTRVWSHDARVMAGQAAKQAAADDQEEGA